MFDPYHRKAPSLDAGASNDLILLTPNDATDIAVGVKGLRIYNPNGTAAAVEVITLAGTDATIHVPANSVTIEPIRIKRLKTGTTALVEVHGYTDAQIVDPNTD